MPVDNELYDRLSSTWWEDGGFLNFLRAGMNPARLGYMRGVLERELGLSLDGLRVLDIGCGGGLLAEEFARLGCRVTGVDPSEESLAAAREHAHAEGLEIEYWSGTAERLPLPDRSFQVAYCADVLEHVDDVERSLAEAARVLEPGGVYLYETVNRTLRSRLLVIKLAQEWAPFAWAEPGLHDWAMFIKPAELEAKLGTAGFEPRGRRGIAARPLAAMRAMRARAKGSIDYAEMGRRMEIHESRDTGVSYAGWAIKPAG
jgi:2-polyprenyl-6-hydroxyphenyl methylase/3-demethylubiquinone-9 3-methyltransferase